MGFLGNWWPRKICRTSSGWAAEGGRPYASIGELRFFLT